MQLAPQNQPIFAFQWENPNTGEKRQLTWTQLPQDFKKFTHYFWNCLGI
jgi:hypothetical protein